MSLLCQFETLFMCAKTAHLFCLLVSRLAIDPTEN